MPAGRIEVDGIRRLRRELRRADVDLSDLRSVNLQAAQIVAAAAQPRTPHRTGALARSVRAGASRTAGVVRAGGARVPYAGPIHWGWPARHIPAQPWLTDTAADTEPLWADRYMQALEDVLDHIAGGPTG
jgi:hypothetical protein